MRSNCIANTITLLSGRLFSTHQTLSIMERKKYKSSICGMYKFDYKKSNCSKYDFEFIKLS